MKLLNFKNFVSKYGFLVSDAKVVPEGISKKNGKPYESFAYFVLLEYGSEKTTTIYIPTDRVTSFLNATSEFDYLEPVEVSGSVDASGRFLAEKIETFNFSEV